MGLPQGPKAKELWSFAEIEAFSRLSSSGKPLSRSEPRLQNSHQIYPSPSEEQPLHLACKEGDLDLVVNLSQRFPLWLIEKDVVGYYPLHIALAFGHEEIVDFLLTVQRGTSNLLLDAFNRRPIHLAVQGRANRIVRRMIEELEICTDEADDSWTNKNLVIHLAAASGNLELVRYLVEEVPKIAKSRPITLHDVNEHGESVIFSAIQNDRLNVFQYCLQALRAEPSSWSGDIGPFIWSAATSGATSIVAYMIATEHDTDADVPQSCGNLIHLSAPNGCLELLQYFKSIDYDPTIPTSDPNGKLNQENAAMDVDEDDFDCLDEDEQAHSIATPPTKARATQSLCSCSPLPLSVHKGHTDVAKFLVSEFGFDPFDPRPGHDCLIIACLSGNLELVEYFAADQSRRRRKPTERALPLISAAKTGQFHVVDWLIDSKIGFIDDTLQGMTAFSWSIAGGNEVMAEYLAIEKGANVLLSGAGTDNFTPLPPIISAILFGMHHLVKVILARAPEAVYAMGVHGTLSEVLAPLPPIKLNTLMWAIAECHLEIAKTLFEKLQPSKAPKEAYRTWPSEGPDFHCLVLPLSHFHPDCHADLFKQPTGVEQSVNASLWPEDVHEVVTNRDFSRFMYLIVSKYPKATADKILPLLTWLMSVGADCSSCIWLAIATERVSPEVVKLLILGDSARRKRCMALHPPPLHHQQCRHVLQEEEEGTTDGEEEAKGKNCFRCGPQYYGAVPMCGRGVVEKDREEDQRQQEGQQNLQQQQNTERLTHLPSLAADRGDQELALFLLRIQYQQMPRFFSFTDQREMSGIETGIALVSIALRQGFLLLSESVLLEGELLPSLLVPWMPLETKMTLWNDVADVGLISSWTFLESFGLQCPELPLGRSSVNSPLFLAVALERWEMMEFLQEERKVELFHPQRKDWTDSARQPIAHPIIQLAQIRQLPLKTWEWLYLKGYSFSNLATPGRVAECHLLHIAVHLNLLHLLKFLHRIGTNIDSCDSAGLSPLFYAAVYGKSVFVKWFLRHGASTHNSVMSVHRFLLKIPEMVVFFKAMIPLMASRAAKDSN